MPLMHIYDFNGNKLSVHPIDAREIVSLGQGTFDPPEVKPIPETEPDTKATQEPVLQAEPEEIPEDFKNTIMGFTDKKELEQFAQKFFDCELDLRRSLKNLQAEVLSLQLADKEE